MMINTVNEELLAPPTGVYRELNAFLLDGSWRHHPGVCPAHVVCHESGTVIFEAKDGAYEPIGEEDILNL